MEVKDLLAALDFNEESAEAILKAEDPKAAFAEQFHGKFISKELAPADKELQSKIAGKALGSITTHAKRTFGFENGDIEGKSVEQIIDLANEKHSKMLEELKTASGGSNDEKVTRLNKQLEDSTKKINELSEFLNAAKQETETVKTGFEKKFREDKINSMVGKAFGSITYKDGLTDLERRGFDAHIRESYQFDIDDKDQLVIKDKNGEPVKNSNKTSYATPDQVFRDEALKNGLVKQNNTNGGEQAKGMPPTILNGNGANGNGAGANLNAPRVSQAALRHSEKLKAQSE